MKCKRCGTELKDNDTVCFNCGFIVSADDIYDDISDDDSDSIEDEDEDASYDKELDDLLDSYKKEDKKKEKHKNKEKPKEEFEEETNEAPDYSSFGEFENKTDFDYQDNEIDDEVDSEYETNIVDNSVDEESSEDNSSDMTFDSLNDYDDKPVKKKSNTSFGIGKIISYVIIGVLGIVVLVLGFKVVSSWFGKSSTFDKKPDPLKVESKYDLKKYPNFITSKTWVCGDPDDNFELSTDVNTFFQYDFDTDNTYAVQYFSNRDVYEDGQYGVSLEDISNNKFTYKITVIATLNAGYKTRYNFYIITNKEGTKATYKLNDTKYPCEEMNYYNSKISKK